MSRSRNTLIPIWAILLAFSPTPRLLGNSLSSVLAQAPSFTLPESLPDNTTVRVDGSSSMIKVNEALKQRYEEQFSNTEVEITTSNSDEALEALEAGDVDIVAVGRPLTAAEKAAGLIAVPVDRAKIAIIVGPGNPFSENLTFEQFAQIFRGEITDWSEVGGEPGPIRLVDRPEFSDTRRALSSYDVFQTAPFATGNTTDPVSEDETADVIQALGEDGISYAIADQVLEDENVKIISMHQTLPDDPRYPYSQVRTYVYNENTATPAVLAFLGFATTEPGQEVIAAATPDPTEVPADTTTATTTPDTTGNGDNPDTATTPEEDSEASATALSPGETPNSTQTAETATTTAPEETEGAGAVVLPGGTAAPEGAPESTTALVPDSDVAGTTTGGKFPWWLLWLLGIPLLGGLLWWLLKGRGGDPTGVTSIPPGTGTTTPPTATPPATTATGTSGATLRKATPNGTIATPDPDVGSVTTTHPPSPRNINLGTAGLAGAGLAGLAGAFAWSRRPLRSQITLTPEPNQQVKAAWDVPQTDMNEARQQGGEQLKLRVYDVTDVDINTEAPHSLQDHDCDEAVSQLTVPVSQGDRNYLAEVGYTTNDNQWLPLCRSNSVYIPASADLPEVETPDVNLGLNTPNIEVPEVETPDVNLGLNLPNVEVPEVETPDVNLGLNLPNVEVPEVETPDVNLGLNLPNVEVPEVPEVERPDSGINLPGIALGGAALAGLGAIPFLGSRQSRLNLTPGENQSVTADWTIPPADIDEARQQGGEQFKLRVYDVTDVDINTEAPHSLQDHDCDEAVSQLTVPVSQGDRNYLAEVGYTTNDNQWLPLCRSNSVYIPASADLPEVETPDVNLGLNTPNIEVPEVETPDINLGLNTPNVEVPEVERPDINLGGLNLPNVEVPEVETPDVNLGLNAPDIEVPEVERPDSGINLPGIALGGAALAGLGAIPFLGSRQSRLSLTPGEHQTITADWTIPQRDMEAAKQQGGQQLQLRVYDITDIDMDVQPPHSVQQHNCDELISQLQTPVEQGDRTYAAVIGYATEDNQWLPLCRSNPVYVPVSADLPEIDTANVNLGLTSPTVDVPEVDTPEVPETELGLTSPTIETPSVDIPEVDTPEVPETELGLTSPTIETPSVDIPEVDTPEVPETELGLDTPTLETPSVDIPEVDTPEIPETELGLDTPTLETPSVDIPEVDTPEVSETELGLTSPTVETSEVETPEVPETDETPSRGINLPSLAVGGAAIVGAIPFINAEQSRLNITPTDKQTVIANWEIPQGDIEAVKQQGGEQLQLRVYDVTDAELDVHGETPQDVQQYNCDESVSEIEVPIAEGERTYAAAIGYVTADDQWLPLCCSEPVTVAATDDLTIEDVESALPSTPVEPEESEGTVTDDPTVEDVESALPSTPVEPEESEDTIIDSPTIEDVESALPSTPVDTIIDSPTIEEVEDTEPAEDTDEPDITLGDAILAGAAMGTVADVSSEHSYVTVTPVDNQTLAIAWEIPPTEKEIAKHQGGEQLQVRVYDVTDINIDTELPDSTQTYDCDELTQDLTVDVPQAGCDYLVEVGYVQNHNQWLPLCRSEIVTVPASALFFSETPLEDTQILAEDRPVISVVSPPPSWLSLTPAGDQSLEARWQIPQDDIDAIKQQGGKQLQLRVYDVTEIDETAQNPEYLQHYDCDESAQTLQVSLPQGDCTYAAALGYVTDDNQWLPLCRSDVIFVPGSQPIITDSLIAESEVTEPEATEPIEVIDPIVQRDCEIQHLTVDSRDHCFLFTPEQLQQIQDIAISKPLEPGLYIIRIKEGTFGYGAADNTREPIILLLIHGGQVINKKTNTSVQQTWSTLNGYHETLTLEVLEPSTLSAFFFDTNPDDNYGYLTLSVVQI